MKFIALDALIVVVYFAATIIAGLLGRRYVSSVSGFLLAGRHLGPFIGIGTLAANDTQITIKLLLPQHRDLKAKFMVGNLAEATIFSSVAAHNVWYAGKWYQIESADLKQNEKLRLPR